MPEHTYMDEDYGRRVLRSRSDRKELERLKCCSHVCHLRFGVRSGSEKEEVVAREETEDEEDGRPDPTHKYWAEELR